MGRAHGVAVPRLAVDMLAGVPVHGVIADEHHRTVGDQVVEREPHQRAAECEPGPRGA